MPESKAFRSMKGGHERQNKFGPSREDSSVGWWLVVGGWWLVIGGRTTVSIVRLFLLLLRIRTRRENTDRVNVPPIEFLHPRTTCNEHPIVALTAFGFTARIPRLTAHSPGVIWQK